MKFNPDESVGFIVSKTSQKMKGHLHQGFKPYDITTEQWGLLSRLWQHDGVSQKELSDKSCKDQPNITRILDKLEEKGLIRRGPNPDDRRALLIYLTEAGWDLKDKLVPIVKESLDKALRGFTQEEVGKLKEMLNRIYCNLDNM